MTYKQPRVPELHEGVSERQYLKTLIPFLKEFALSAWKADTQREKEIGFVGNSIVYPVMSVNGEKGDVMLDAAAVGARPDTWTPDAEAVGALPEKGIAEDSGKLGGKAPEHYIRPQNLLDNSDFEIAQAGYGGYHGATIYAADRWAQNDAAVRTYTKVTHNSHGALRCGSNTRIQQKLYLVEGQAYTGAFYINNRLYLHSFTASGGNSGSGSIWINQQSDGRYMFIITGIPAEAVISEPVLYPGTYTAETLPPYKSKGYAAEWGECRRYYKIIKQYTHAMGTYMYASYVRFVIPFEPMRISGPTPLIGTQCDYLPPGGDWTAFTPDGIAVNGNTVTISYGSAASSTPGYACLFRGEITLSAD